MATAYAYMAMAYGMASIMISLGMLRAGAAIAARHAKR